jgi:hypothetical protein
MLPRVPLFVFTEAVHTFVNDTMHEIIRRKTIVYFRYILFSQRKMMYFLFVLNITRNKALWTTALLACIKITSEMINIYYLQSTTIGTNILQFFYKLFYCSFILTKMDHFKGNENTDANDQICQHFSTWKLRTVSFSYSVLVR